MRLIFSSIFYNYKSKSFLGFAVSFLAGLDRSNFHIANAKQFLYLICSIQWGHAFTPHPFPHPRNIMQLYLFYIYPSLGRELTHHWLQTYAYQSESKISKFPLSALQTETKHRFQRYECVRPKNDLGLDTVWKGCTTVLAQWTASAMMWWLHALSNHSRCPRWNDDKLFKWNDVPTANTALCEIHQRKENFWQSPRGRYM